MEIGFRINFYRNTEDALEDIPPKVLKKLLKLSKTLPKLPKVPPKLG